MKIAPNTQTIIAAVGAVVVLAYFFRSQASEAISAVTDINEDTPFEGAGVVGVLGNITNQASGGILADAGSAIGLFFSDLLSGRISQFGRAGGSSQIQSATGFDGE